MTGALIGSARRWSALLLLKLARLTLRGAILYRLSGLPLHLALSVTRVLEKLGARLVLGPRRYCGQPPSDKD